MPLFDRLVTFMRFLHTSDLHLGRSLYGVNRDETFEKFLAWLTEIIRCESIDCLIIAGDVFDNATPSHRMQRMISVSQARNFLKVSSRLTP